MKSVLLACTTLLFCATAVTSCKKRDTTNNSAVFCKATGLTIYQKGTSELTLPDAFTPNGDGKNDVFLPVMKNIDTASYSLTVVQGLDAIYFHTTNPKEGWGGPSRTAVNYTPGLYAVSIHFKTADGTEVDGCNFVNLLGTDTSRDCIYTSGSIYNFADQVNPANPAAGFKLPTAEIACP